MMMMSKEGSAMPFSLAKVAGLVAVSRATGRTARHRRNWSKCEFRRHPGLRATAGLIRACPGPGRGGGGLIIAGFLPTRLLHSQHWFLPRLPSLWPLLAVALAHF